MTQEIEHQGTVAPAPEAHVVGAIEIAEAMRDKHSTPTGDQYNCGAWDMAQRIISKLRSSTTQMVVVSTTDIDHNGEHIERLIPASDWRSAVAEWQRYTDSFGWQRVEETEIEHYRNKGSSLRALYEHPPAKPRVQAPDTATVARHMKDFEAFVAQTAPNLHWKVYQDLGADPARSNGYYDGWQHGLVKLCSDLSRFLISWRK